MSLQAPPDFLLSAYPWAYREFATRAVWALQSDPRAFVTSWFRDRAENARVGGAEYSQHRLGFAIDLVTADPRAIAQRMRDAGLVPVVEGDHVHVQAFRAGVIPRRLFTV